LTHVEKINDPKFAYYPYTLILRQKIYNALGDSKNEQLITETLHRDYSDLWDWLLEVRPTMTKPEQWRA
jgi:hypothetical protein